MLPDDLYDLPMKGVERLDVEHEYQRRTGGPEVRGSDNASATIDIDGPFVTSWLTGARFRLQQEAGEAPSVYESGRYLPPDTVFVVRPGALEKLIQQVSEASPEEKRVTRERDTLQEAMPTSEVAAESDPALRAPTVPEPESGRIELCI